MAFFSFPWTNFHETNENWMISKMMQWEEEYKNNIDIASKAEEEAKAAKEAAESAQAAARSSANEAAFASTKANGASNQASAAKTAAEAAQAAAEAAAESVSYNINRKTAVKCGYKFLGRDVYKIVVSAGEMDVTWNGFTFSCKNISTGDEEIVNLREIVSIQFLYESADVGEFRRFRPCNAGIVNYAIDVTEDDTVISFTVSDTAADGDYIAVIEFSAEV